MEIGCILMASGSAMRYGGNKLLAPFYSKTVIECTMDALPHKLFSTVLVVTGSKQIEQFAHARGFETVKNNFPNLGVCHTIKLGLQALPTVQACLFCVGDQPLVSKSSIEKLVHEYQSGIFALAYNGKRGNPVLFPASLFPELMSLSSQQSGSTVIQAHPELLHLLEVQNDLELFDIDTKADYAYLEQAFNNR